MGRAREVLTAASIDDAALESEMLLRYVLNLSRVELFQQLNTALTPGQEQAFAGLVARRLSREPTAYITGHREFYGLDFYVDRRVLIPRPETELLVEKAIALAEGNPIAVIADVGTGSGAIAVSLAVNLPGAKIYATDIAADALDVARLNCRKHGVAGQIGLLEGDLLDPLPRPVDIIVANLPYVRKSDLAQVNTIDFEPKIALDGGADGLDKLRCLCQQVPGKLRHGGHILLEIGQGQGEAISMLLHRLFPFAGVEVTPDLAGIDRVVAVTLTVPVFSSSPSASL
ncbi:MAG: peptide chain release factor N(5)-glutamine methyltransferase [Chloroflexi bacterium]|nr:peptide chain release factor N(5)-glutamine methyltransferase [Chloroflexota bacterium]